MNTPPKLTARQLLQAFTDEINESKAAELWHSFKRALPRTPKEEKLTELREKRKVRIGQKKTENMHMGESSE